MNMSGARLEHWSRHMETFQTCLDILSDIGNKGGNFENKAEVIAAFAVSTNIKTVIKSILGHINSFKSH